MQQDFINDMELNINCMINSVKYILCIFEWWKNCSLHNNEEMYKQTNTIFI